MVYLLLIYNNKVKKMQMVFLGILSFVVYKFCGSRNAFLGSVLLIGCYLVFMKNRKSGIKEKCIVEISKYAMVIASIFSILPSYFRCNGLNMSLWDLMDKIFTNRTLLGAAAINKFGLHLLNFMKTREYLNTEVIVDSSLQRGIVLDNGYLYITVRYGVLVLAISILIYNALYKQYVDSPLICAVLIVVVFANFTDNDLLSYGFLPMMVVGVQKLCASQKMKSKKEIRGEMICDIY